MWYEINVSKDNKHYFATHKRSLDTEQEARTLYAHFCKLFPESEGYNVTVSERCESAMYLQWPKPKADELKQENSK